MSNQNGYTKYKAPPPPQLKEMPHKYDNLRQFPILYAESLGAKFHWNETMGLWVCLDEKPTSWLRQAYFFSQLAAARAWLYAHGYTELMTQ